MVRAWGTVPPEGFHVGLAIEDPPSSPRRLQDCAPQPRRRGQRRHARGTSFTNGTGILTPSAPSRSSSSPLGWSRWPLRSRTAGSLPPTPRSRRRRREGHQQGQPEPARRTAAAPAGQGPRRRRQLAQGERVVRQFLVSAGIDDGDFFSTTAREWPTTMRRPTRLYPTAGLCLRQSWGPAWRDTFPIAGVDGTLAGRFKSSPLKAHLWAKTHAQRGQRALRLPHHGHRQNPGVFHSGQRTSPRQRRRTRGHRPHRRSHRGGPVTCIK